MCLCVSVASFQVGVAGFTATDKEGKKINTNNLVTGENTCSSKDKPLNKRSTAMLQDSDVYLIVRSEILI